MSKVIELGVMVTLASTDFAKAAEVTAKLQLVAADLGVPVISRVVTKRDEPTKRTAKPAVPAAVEQVAAADAPIPGLESVAAATAAQATTGGFKPAV